MGLRQGPPPNLNGKCRVSIIFFILPGVFSAMTVPTHVAIIISVCPPGIREANHADPVSWPRP
jgi:hypothetical protein